MSSEAPLDIRASSFGPVAPYYDELMRQVPYRMWVAYYLLLLSEQDVHPTDVLDVCCGTGTMCEMLTREGLSMTGIDLSPGMIEEARRKAAVKKMAIDYHVADATSFQLDRRFRAAYSFFDSLNNIIEPEGFQNALCRISDHLTPGGSIIFDLNTRFAFEERMFDQQNLRRNARLRYRWSGDWDPETRLIKVQMKFWYGNQEFEEVHVQRAYEHEEVLAMLREAGFWRLRAYHSYTLDAPRRRSDRIHYTAIKR